MPNKFIAVDPQGVTHKRTSQNRNYSHCVVVLNGQANLDAAKPDPAKIKAGNDEMWDRIENEAKGVFPKSEMCRGPNALKSWQESAVRYMSGHTRESDLAEAMEHAESVYAHRLEEGRDLRYVCVGWCGRLDLARKLAAQHTQAEKVVILEATKL